uniref:Uncharacterized protein n=1 Tax=Grammatophora oceanica TaxID=210454 RepID=A0A7S1VEN8_9STRA
MNNSVWEKAGSSSSRSHKNHKLSSCRSFFFFRARLGYPPQSIIHLLNSSFRLLACALPVVSIDRRCMLELRGMERCATVLVEEEGSSQAVGDVARTTPIESWSESYPPLRCDVVNKDGHFVAS